MDDRAKKGNRRRLAFLTLCALLLTLPVGSVRAEVITRSTQCDVSRDAQGNLISQDAGGAKGSASLLTIPASCQGQLTAGVDNEDWYKIENTVGRKVDGITVVAEPPLLSVGIRLLNEALEPVTDSNGNPICTDSNPRDTCKSWTATTNDFYYLVLTRENGSGPYTLSAEGTLAQHDCGTPGDAPADFPDTDTGVPSPKPIALKATDPSTPRDRVVDCFAYFDGPDTADVYTFFMAQNVLFELDLTGLNKQTLPSWEIRGPDGASLDMDEECLPNEIPPVNAWTLTRCKPLASGFHTLRLQSGEARAQGYIRIPIKIRMQQTDCGYTATLKDLEGPPLIPTEPRDASDTAATARLKFAGRCFGSLDAEPAASPSSAALDPIDRLSIDSLPASIRFDITPPAGNCIQTAITPPSAGTTSLRICGAASDPQLTSVTLAGSVTGDWAIDVTADGITAGVPSSTVRGGAYEIVVVGALQLDNDCGSGSDVSTYQPKIPTRIDPDTRRIRAWDDRRRFTCDGDLRTPTDLDTFRITDVGASDQIDVRLSGSPGLESCLRAPGQSESTCRTATSVRATATEVGTWSVTVRRTAGVGVLPYNLEVEIISQNDCGDVSATTTPSFVDAGDLPSNATPLKPIVTPADVVTGGPIARATICSPATTSAGRLRGTLDTEDWYSVRLDNQVSTFVATVVQPRFTLCVIRPGAVVPECDYAAEPPESGDLPDPADSLPRVIAANPCTGTDPENPSCDGQGVWKIGVILGPREPCTEDCVALAVEGSSYDLIITGRN